jgi:hypothetical protein
MLCSPMTRTLFLFFVIDAFFWNKIHFSLVCSTMENCIVQGQQPSTGAVVVVESKPSIADQKRQQQQVEQEQAHISQRQLEYGATLAGFWNGLGGMDRFFVIMSGLLLVIQLLILWAIFSRTSSVTNSAYDRWTGFCMGFFVAFFLPYITSDSARNPPVNRNAKATDAITPDVGRAPTPPIPRSIDRSKRSRPMWRPKQTNQTRHSAAKSRHYNRLHPQQHHRQHDESMIV